MEAKDIKKIAVIGAGVIGSSWTTNFIWKGYPVNLWLYKSDEEAWSLAKESGWQPIAQFFDEPSHHHCMTVAKKI